MNRAHWILRTIDRLGELGDWPVLLALAFGAGVLITLGAAGAL